jgi:hypothetical protein
MTTDLTQPTTVTRIRRSQFRVGPHPRRLIPTGVRTRTSHYPAESDQPTVKTIVPL